MAHLLPMQGPIGVFIHHNTLHAFQHLKFEDAVLAASDIYGTEPFMREDAYHRELECGRIRQSDIDWVLGRESNARIIEGRLDRTAMRRAMLAAQFHPAKPDTVRWRLEEEADTFGGPLFAECLRRTDAVVSAPRASFPALRASFPALRASFPALRASVGRSNETHEIVHPVLIRLTAAFLDQGMAYWAMPQRELGFLASVRLLFGQPGMVHPENLSGLAQELARQKASGSTAADTILSLLDRMEIDESQWESFVTRELLALPGWAGLMRVLEQKPDAAPHERLPCSLMEFLAVRLTLTFIAASNLAAMSEPEPLDIEAERLAAAVNLFDVACAIGLSATDMISMDSEEFARLRHELAIFDERERRRVLHLAYEYRHELEVLLPLRQYRESIVPSVMPRVAAQVFFCLDEREESTRRHLEEVDPEIETFGAAGFYGIAMEYTGIDDAHGAALCPIVTKPQHAVLEKPQTGEEHLHRRRQSLRRFWATYMRNWFVSSRSFVRGWFSTVVLGIFSIFPLIGRVLAPRHFARFCEMLHRSVLPEPRTELVFRRSDAKGHVTTEGLFLGFSLQEKIDRVAGILEPAGLTRSFARLVVVLGHGSNSLNNPLSSAYNCGACGGRRGGPNGRGFAAMANDRRVRAGLAARGIAIPEDCWFIGGEHDTCNDEITLFDEELVPASHSGDLTRIVQSLDRTRALNAQERIRRFESARFGLDPAKALHHVEERAEHLGEPRPECGHATNASCIIGRRAVTRGLFLDRRAFLTSYDVKQDPNNASLAQLLAAAIPVCAGINLEYYFSYVDTEGYGCGSKLPHNITGLLGIMNGQSSDLRTGLPVQMVEIHEPVRCLFVIESTPDRVLSTINKSPVLAEFLHNRWIRLATLDPDTGEIHSFRDGAFEVLERVDCQIPSVRKSIEWYQGKRGHLPVARIVEAA